MAPVRTPAADKKGGARKTPSPVVFCTGRGVRERGEEEITCVLWSEVPFPEKRSDG